MKHTNAGNGLAVGLLLLGTVWMVLRLSGLFEMSPVQFPRWAGFPIALGILLGPAILICLRSLSWILSIAIAMGFLACAFVFPWFYDQLPLYFWLTIVLAYVEIFWLIPLYMKRGRSLGADS
jgi:hypothetical protein